MNARGACGARVTLGFSSLRGTQTAHLTQVEHNTEQKKFFISVLCNDRLGQSEIIGAID